MIWYINNLRIFSQNVRQNQLLFNTILKTTQNNYNVIFIQELL